MIDQTAADSSGAATRQCSKCLQVHPIEAFPVRKHYRIGSCKECLRIQKAAWRDRNRDKVRASDARRYWRGRRESINRAAIEAQRSGDALRTDALNRLVWSGQKLLTKFRLNRKKKSSNLTPRERLLRYKYRMSPRQYNEMATAQGGKCAICGTQTPDGDRVGLCIDHCHATGAVRSLLCYKCNVGLGIFNDSPELLEVAAAYLRAHRKKEAA